MPVTASRPHDVSEDAFVIALVGEVLKARTVEELAGVFLPGFASFIGSDAVLLYLADERLTKSSLFQQGFRQGAPPELEKVCAQQYNKLLNQENCQPVSVIDPLTCYIPSGLKLYPLRTEDRCVGLVGLTPKDEIHPNSTSAIASLLGLLSACISNILDQVSMEKQLSELQLY